VLVPSEGSLSASIGSERKVDVNVNAFEGGTESDAMGESQSVNAGAVHGHRTRRARLIALYLPQFHPIPENDTWWGPGFTEWTNVAKARPLFSGHYQPRIPADLGFYDLRLPETRAAQAKLAREAGIEGFCYWHYWFDGKRLLERPFNDVLRSGEPNFPFCLGWANQSWSGIWHGAPGRILMEQTYPGAQDDERHFHALLPAFHDRRYVTVRSMPVFVIYQPRELPHLRAFIERWQRLASRNGLKGVHFIAHLSHHEWAVDYESLGFAGATVVTNLKMGATRLRDVAAMHAERIRHQSGGLARIAEAVRAVRRISFYARRKVRHRMPWPSPAIFYYEDAAMFFLNQFQPKPNCYPCVIPDWDNSPRTGRRGVILHGSTPELFRRHVQAAMQLVEQREFDDRVIFVKSWNEWAEGNYLEPDQRFGRQYLDVLGETVFARVR
jgi:hypothetical protein